MKTRIAKKLLSYATEDGERPLKQRGIESFAPSAAAGGSNSRLTLVPSGPQVTGGTSSGEKETVVVHPRVLKLLASRCKSHGTPRVISKAQAHVVKFSTPRTATASFTVKRVEMKNVQESMDAVALAALQRVATQADPAAQSCLVLCDSNRTVEALSTKLKATYGMQVLVLDTTVKFPVFPCPSAKALKASTAGDNDDMLDAAVVTVVLATVPAFLSIDKRSQIWKHCGALLLLANGGKLARAVRESSEAVATHRLNVPARVCLVLGDNAREVSNADLNSIVFPTKEVAGDAPRRQEVTVSCMTNEGAARFQALYALVLGQAKNLNATIVVHFDTAEGASFMCDALFAIQELPENYTVVCDSEDGRGERLEQSFEGVKETVLAKVDAAERRGAGPVLLLSSYGLVPPTKTSRVNIFLQYDPILRIENFNTFVATQLTSGVAMTKSADPVTTSEEPVAPAVVAKTPSKKRAGTPPPTPRAILPMTSTTTMSTQLSTPEGVSQQQQQQGNTFNFIVVFFSPNEAYRAMTLLAKSGDAKRLGIKYTRIPPPPPVSGLLAARKLKSLHKKIFTIANKAFEAYRSLMQVYSRLHPCEVYDVYKLNLQQSAEQFGFDEAPLLDLRTKANHFRPKEDVVKASRKRLTKQRQETRRFADANIIGEGPEDHLVPDAVEGDE